MVTGYFCMIMLISRLLFVHSLQHQACDVPVEGLLKKFFKSISCDYGVAKGCSCRVSAHHQ
jgi:hypothetical protein